MWAPKELKKSDFVEQARNNSRKLEHGSEIIRTEGSN